MLIDGKWVAQKWVSRRPMPGDVLRAVWAVGCSCLSRGGSACGCSWRGWRDDATMIFVVLESDEPGSGPRLEATCVPLYFDKQEELSSTSAWCYKVGVPFRANDMMTPVHNAEVVAEGSAPEGEEIG